MMKHYIFLLLLILTLPVAADNHTQPADSAYLFAYSTSKNGSRNGMHYAWSYDRNNWNAIGPEFRYLFCDYGNWGWQKRLITPFLFQDENLRWHSIWSLNDNEGIFAHSYSEDLVYWYPQIYPKMSDNRNIRLPEVSYQTQNKHYLISWLSDNPNGKPDVFSTTTRDFKKFTPAVKANENVRLNLREEIMLNENRETGIIRKISAKELKTIIEKYDTEQIKKARHDETTREDATRYAGLQSLNATLTVKTTQSKPISDKLIGIFYEDINYAADGGLYAELIQNRGFEYHPADKRYRENTWNNRKSWTLAGENASFDIDSVNPVHPNNKHFAVLNISKPGAALQNEGFSGIALKAGDLYDLSAFIRIPAAKKIKLLVRLTGKNNEDYGSVVISSSSKKWKKAEAVIKATKTASDAKLEIIPQSAGVLHLDMISLFPQKTFMNRKNGLRADLAQTIADIKPQFMRFPGGCVAHGDGLHNMYRWKNTIGPLESRKPQSNIWNYHQSMGLGYFEYFRFCKDIGAEPIPVVAAGVPCQNSSVGGYGQQGGIPMCEMHDYVQEVLDLIEWANGDPKKSKLAKMRAQAGHPAPFNLKYVGVGNEDLINDIFEERFTMIFNAVKEKYPEIVVIGTAGPFNEGTDYVEGWKIARKLNIPMMDEHYYQTPGWFIHNNDFYDKYDRNGSKVYLGEYAAHLPGRPNNIETALAEAHYLTALERNGDIVSMTSYAPLLAKEGYTQWNPNLIYFNNTEVKPTVGYHVQKMYGLNAGDHYIENKLTLSNEDFDVKKRVATSVVRDSKTGDLIIKLVNILPVEIKTAVNLDGVNAASSATRTVLKGDPADRRTVPTTDNIAAGNQFSCTLAPYSFTLIRIKTQ